MRIRSAGLMTLTDAALAYAAAGMAVLPLHRPITQPDGRTGCSCRDAKCRSIGKHPRTPHGLHDATAEPARVAAWWRRWPQANIGLATGARFDVLDVDGPVGLRALRRLAEGGLSLSGPLVRTGGAGWHYYLAPLGRGNAQPIRTLQRVDWRGLGGYVVAPPSRHASGARYRWLRSLTAELPQVPAPLRELLIAAPVRACGPRSTPIVPRSYAHRALIDECTDLAATAPGGRNGRLWRAACNLYNFVAGGVLTDEEVEAALLAAADACGLLAEEPHQTRRTIQSGRTVGLAHPRGGGGPPRPAPQAGWWR